MKETKSKSCLHQSQQSNNNTNDDENTRDDEKDDASLGHEWYFTYEELKSLILPLILGCRGEEFDQWSDDEGEDEGDMWEEEEMEVKVDHSDKSDEVEVKKSSSLCQKKAIDDHDDNQDDTTTPIQEGKDHTSTIDDNEEGWNKDVDNKNYDMMYKAFANDDDNNNNKCAKKVLEIGCGDIPLGQNLCQDLLHF